MSGCARHSDRRPGRAALAALLVLLAGGGWAGAQDAAVLPPGAPARVVSMNLCTDQLAMLLAGPGQLVSVSDLARDPLASAMAQEAGAFAINHGQAEEIFLLRPDLVLAGSYTTPATVALLRRLGIPVAVFAPATSLAEVPVQMRAMGAALGRGAEAEALAAAFDADLARLTASAGPGPRPRAAIYMANGYTVGEGTLSGDVLAAAGFANVAAEAGLSGGGVLALESLVMAEPDLVVSGPAYPGASRSEDILAHPALVALKARHAGLVLNDRDWICGTPHLLRALARLVEERAALEDGV